MSKVLIFWYIFCAINIALVLWIMHRLTHSKFRDGDENIEVGYEEDSEGHDLTSGDPDDTSVSEEEPHIAINPGTGPM